ncbi:hypothetical protein FN846DRAFT_987238 [Sphaerosporella brunnea]|uniref:Uncharacterized protein n=1 Tax=Sphaerosporella brunnea TaxID=1250544 RepID=A0A5J5ESY0_9PEZI|nr:hypothetical protein FN846DRAFT_987238 [Sphaerosporella brunnea]
MARLSEKDGGLARPGETQRESLRSGRLSRLHRKLGGRIMRAAPVSRTLQTLHDPSYASPNSSGTIAACTLARRLSTRETDETERQPSRLPRDRQDSSRPHDSYETENLGENSRLLCYTALCLHHGKPLSQGILLYLGKCALMVAKFITSLRKFAITI